MNNSAGVVGVRPNSDKEVRGSSPPPPAMPAELELAGSHGACAVRYHGGDMKQIEQELICGGFCWEPKRVPPRLPLPIIPPQRARGKQPKRDPAYTRAYRQAQYAKWRAMGIVK